MQQMVKYGKYAGYAMESCPVKVVMSGGAGEYFALGTSRLDKADGRALLQGSVSEPSFPSCRRHSPTKTRYRKHRKSSSAHEHRRRSSSRRWVEICGQAEKGLPKSARCTPGSSAVSKA
jgi:hypothetical protein